jgi:primosomal protein N' (replication factor Y)
MKIAEVIVDIANSAVDKIYDYYLPDGFTVGQRVLVPFGPREIEGYIINIKEDTDYDKSKLKTVVKPLEAFPVISAEMLALVAFMRRKYNLLYVDCINAFLPAEMRGGRVKELVRLHAKYVFDGDDLARAVGRSAAQLELAEYMRSNGREVPLAELNKNFGVSAVKGLINKGILSAFEKPVYRAPYKQIEPDPTVAPPLKSGQAEAATEISAGNGGTYLLHGVTGSGKTEVYLKCISEIIAQDKAAVMLVPEIALTPQALRLFRERFGSLVALLHSGLSDGERFDEWHRCLTGEAKIAVGARSAVFAPLKNLGIIIIDEEHEPSYISASSPRYITSEIAEFRRGYNNCKLVFGSATPSVDTYYKAVTGKYKLLELSTRINEKPLPKFITADMRTELLRGNAGFISSALMKELEDCVKSGNQAMLYINRRGYASFQMCRACGFVKKCANCDVSMVVHLDDRALKCHYCSAREEILRACPECNSPHIRLGMLGTERLEEEIKKLFPTVVVARMDSDTTQKKDAALKILSDFRAGKIQILIGTQMIAKGHDFPNVTLMGMLDADISLHISDYRAYERTYQLVTQAAGRAGRDKKEGVVVLQTYTPRHYVYRFALNNDYKGFYSKEINLRETSKYPPFCLILRILCTSIDEQKGLDNLKKIFEGVSTIAAENKQNFLYFKAMRAPIKRIENKFRCQIIMRLAGDNLDSLISRIYNIVDAHRDSEVSCITELNPKNMS